MRNIFYKLLFICGALLSLHGCALENEIYDEINPDIFPQSAEDVDALVTASVYNVFCSDQYNGIFAVATGYVTSSDIVTDQMECSWEGWLQKYNSYEAGYWYIDGDAGTMGRAVYQFAYRLSSMILTKDRIKDVDMDQALKGRYTAELECGIGFLAFLLYDLYGTIPLPDLETLKNPTADKILPRATEEEMREFIVTNLTEAAKVLPYSYQSSEYGRFTKGLANTLLLKYYMRIGDWDGAVKIGEELTTNEEYGYALVDNYYDLFSLTTEQNTEVIFAAQAIDGSMENNWFAHVLPGDFPTASGVSKWNGFKMAWPFYQSYDPKDKRLERIYGEYTSDDGKVHSYENDRMNGSMGENLYLGAVPMKYSLDGVKGENNQTDLVIYRYADVITLYAEALVRKNNTVSQTSLNYLNEIRVKHGGLTAYRMSEVSDTNVFLEKMLEERGHEFYFEGVRRQDLIRHGKFIEKAIEKNRFAGQSTEKVATMAEGKYKYELYPLPLALITEGQGVIKQNPGY